jgi:predicted DCC family thiol-disulfide oxidoreductase YuxK
MENNNPIILFDGVCNLCNGAVQFVIRHDKKNVFRFAALQSETGITLSKKYNIPIDRMDTFVVIKNNKCYTRSNAALEVANILGGFWAILYILVIIPPAIRDTIYDWVAKNRYRMFGKKESCMIPTPELRDRFL